MRALRVIVLLALTASPHEFMGSVDAGIFCVRCWETKSHPNHDYSGPPLDPARWENRDKHRPIDRIGVLEARIERLERRIEILLRILEAAK